MYCPGSKVSPHSQVPGVAINPVMILSFPLFARHYPQTRGVHLVGREHKQQAHLSPAPFGYTKPYGKVKKKMPQTKGSFARFSFGRGYLTRILYESWVLMAQWPYFL